MKVCAKCGAELQPGQTACGVCGAPVEAAAGEGAPVDGVRADRPRPTAASPAPGGFRLSVRPSPRAGAAYAGKSAAARRDEPATAQAAAPPASSTPGPATPPERNPRAQAAFVLVDEAAPATGPAPATRPEPAPRTPPPARFSPTTPVPSLGGPSLASSSLASPSEPRSRFDELGFLFAKRRPPTIALVGMSNVGKTFFFNRLEHIAREEGMALRRRTGLGAIDFDVGGRRPWERDIQSTRETIVYSLGRSGKKSRDSLWIIDMRGEVFREALERHFRDSRLEEVKEFWMILAAAQAYILMTPAAEALQLGDDESDVLWDLTQGLEPMSAAIHMLERRIAQNGGDVQKAVEALAALTPQDLADELDHPRERCRKPVLMLLTQADVMLKAARQRFGAAADLDSDPMRVAAWRSRSLFNQLLGWFDYFKIDFVTACDGHDRSRTVMDIRNPSYGVWESLTWAKRMAKRAGRRATAPLWRTRYAVLYRRLVDGNFRDGLSRR
jgi:hypothetical protein